MANTTTPGYEPGIANRDEFVARWNEFMRENGVTQIPAQTTADFVSIMGAVAPLYLVYYPPTRDKLPVQVAVDLLYGYSSQSKNETAEMLLVHQELLTQGEAAGPDTRIPVLWDQFIAPKLPAPPAIPSEWDGFIGPAVVREQVPSDWKGSLNGYYSRGQKAMSLPVGMQMIAGGVRYILVPVPWQTNGMFGGVPLVWQKEGFGG